MSLQPKYFVDQFFTHVCYELFFGIESNYPVVLSSRLACEKACLGPCGYKCCLGG